jgi:hypothetical protein
LYEGGAGEAGSKGVCVKKGLGGSCGGGAGRVGRCARAGRVLLLLPLLSTQMQRRGDADPSKGHCFSVRVKERDSWPPPVEPVLHNTNTKTRAHASPAQ